MPSGVFTGCCCESESVVQAREDRDKEREREREKKERGRIDWDKAKARDRPRSRGQLFRGQLPRKGENTQVSKRKGRRGIISRLNSMRYDALLDEQEGFLIYMRAALVTANSGVGDRDWIEKR
jgi:hypothetical protein